MTIAVAVIVRPSRLLGAALRCLGLGLLLAAWLLWGVHPSPASPPVALLSILCALTGGAAFLFSRTVRKHHRLDVTGTGQIRLADTSLEAFVHGSPPARLPPSGGEVVQLLGDSTLWPFMLILRLRSKSTGQVTVVPVLPDSLDSGSRHALLVACRWVAARQTKRTVKFQ